MYIYIYLTRRERERGGVEWGGFGMHGEKSDGWQHPGNLEFSGQINQPACPSGSRGSRALFCFFFLFSLRPSQFTLLNTTLLYFYVFVPVIIIIIIIFIITIKKKKKKILILICSNYKYSSDPYNYMYVWRVSF